MNMKFRLSVVLAVVAGLLTAAVGASAFHADEQEYHPIEREAFEDVWERNDRAVAETIEPRSWTWGPGGFSPVMNEPYQEADGGEREVQYFDKSRMEMPNTEGGDPESPWFITQGRLAYELMTGNLQLGDEDFERHLPSQRSAAGDPEDTTAPTYEAMGDLMDRPARASGEVIIEYANRNGFVVEDAGRFAGYGVVDLAGEDTYGDVDGIDHNIADVFWEYMNSEGTIYENGDYVEDQPLFQNAFYAVGFPLTDAFWADVLVDGQMQHVLIQAFERRVLTYAPANPEGWEVESGNIGQHYYDWRYNEIGDPIADVTLALEQEHDANLVSTEHEFTATLTETDGGASVDFDADDVSITITRGADTITPSDLTVDSVTDGVATMTYTGPSSPSTDEIDVTLDYFDTDVTGEPTLTKTWQSYGDFHGCDAVVENGESIQTAINDSVDGDTICVMEGTYTEALNITGSDNLTLLGEGSDLVTIDASAESGYGIDGSYGSTSPASDVTLQGFTLYGPRQGIEEQNFGLKMSDIDGLWIEDVHVRESRRTGIDFIRTTNVTMLNVESHDNDANGIAIRDSSVVSVDNASTSGNGWGGLALYAPGAEAIDDVEIVNSSFADEGAGVYLQHSDHTNIRILDSTFTGNGVGLGFDTETGEAPDVDVLGNIFTNNTAAIGVAADVDVSNIVINNNSIAGNDDGISNTGDGALDATENWWGDPDGPTHTTNPGGSGDSVSDDVDFSNWLTSDPF